MATAARGGGGTVRWPSSVDSLHCPTTIMLAGVHSDTSGRQMPDGARENMFGVPMPSDDVHRLVGRDMLLEELLALGERAAVMDHRGNGARGEQPADYRKRRER